MKLTTFNEIDFLPALKTFFRELHIPINYIDDKPTSAKKILQDTYRDSEAFKLINDVYSLGLVDDAAFRGNPSLAIDKIKSDYDGILIFGVTLSDRMNGLLPTRSHLAEISRAFNREFCYTPVVVVFRYSGVSGEYLAFANTERLKYKNNREGEKSGKVILLRDINIRHPHSGHKRILAELGIPTTGKDRVDSFDKLYQYWQKVLDVSLLNKQFYQEVSTWYFHACKQVVFPKDAKSIQESLIRLITRLMFVWFLKEKGLVSSELFDRADIQSILKSLEPQESTYYKAILQNLFFATLNTDGDRKFIKESSGGRNSQFMVHNVFRYRDYFQDPDRVIDRYFADIPFLNGGLFECLDTEPEKDKPEIAKRIDGFSNNSKNVLSVPNDLFFGDFQDVDLNADFGTSRKKYRVRGLLEIFKSYKFTITENTPFEEDVALDPELLGQVFENLLATYNPETQTTARKQTGSFYTPREIVNYMVDESLIAYFKHQIDSPRPDLEGSIDNKLRHLFAYTDEPHPFTESEVERLIKALDNCKILDPACGSGAFPMGVLQKMVHILAKLDPRNLSWKKRQIERLNQLIVDAEDIEDEKTRTDTLANLEAQKENLERAFARNGLDYGRKLFLIQNCIYGVDIQAIAVQIAKLRFFISLIIDQREDRDEPNRGILPLPNLETKFVAANSLIGVAKAEQLSVFDTQEIQAKRKRLERLRRDHFFAKSLETKRKKRQEDERLCQEIGEILQRNNWPYVESLQSWKPYDQNASADFFDPEWMFGISDGFDVVIGNPPYVRQEQIKEFKPVFKQNFQCFTGVADLFVYFFERGYQLLNTGGVLSYICSNKYFRSGYGEKLRNFLSKNTTIQQLIDFGDTDVFTAIAYPSIILCSKEKASNDNQLKALSWQQTESLNEFPTVFKAQNFLMPQSALKADGWRLEDTKVLDLLTKLRNAGKPLGEYVSGKFYRGILTGFNEAFVINRETKDKLITDHPPSAKIFKPFLRGRDVKKWSVDFADQYLIKIESSENKHHPWSNKSKEEAEKIFGKSHPAIYKHFEQFRSQLIARSDQGKFFWELRSCKYWNEFEQPKIILGIFMDKATFAFDKNGFFANNALHIIAGADEYVTAVLNSSVGWWYLKGICTDLQNGYLQAYKEKLEQIPIPTATAAEQKAIETLVNYVLQLTTILKDIPNSDDSSMDKLMTRYFEQILDAVVMELYLPEELHEHDKHFISHILLEDLPNIDTIKGEKIQTLRKIFNRLFDKDHPIRVGIFFLDSIPVVRTIRGLK